VGGVHRGICPVTVAQRSGQLEPLLFEVVLLAFVVGSWAPSQTEAVALGLLALVAPVAASLIQDPSEIFVGIWLIGIAFPWLIGRAGAGDLKPLSSGPWRRSSTATSAAS
jgi:hypothetical protein